jgi:16S rRNA (uracil1498-N3)-methyltransferase
VSAPIFLVERERLLAATICLDGPEGRHAAVVRRIGVGERVDLTDGAGTVVECTVADADAAGQLRLEALARHELPPPRPRLVVVQALPKGDRGELAVETLTEVGADVVVPWAASRCVTQWRAERGRRSLEKWRATAREATKQARRGWLPQVTDLATTEQVAGLLAAATLPVVLHEQATTALSRTPVPDEGDLVVVVGPEGGVSPDELDRFSASGARVYRLGPTVLRTSTAGVAAAALLLSRTGRWG